MPELALATVLLVGAALLVRSLLELQRVPLGFDPDGVVAFQISLPTTKYNGVKRVAFYRELGAALEGGAWRRTTPACRAAFRSASATTRVAGVRAGKVGASARHIGAGGLADGQSRFLPDAEDPVAAGP